MTAPGAATRKAAPTPMEAQVNRFGAAKAMAQTAPMPAPAIIAEAPAKAPERKVYDLSNKMPQVVLPTFRAPASLGNWIKLAGAALIWYYGGVGTTIIFLEQLLARDVSIWWGVGMQLLLSTLERDFFLGRRTRLTTGAFVLDGLINLVICWAIVPRLFETDAWRVVAQVAHIYGGPSDTLRLGLALGLGLFIAWVPDALAKSATT